MDTNGKLQRDEYLIPGASLARLIREYEQHGSLIVGCDFDSTLYNYRNIGTTYNQVKQLLRDLKSIGCKIIIWTAYKDLVFVKQYCEQNNIPCDGVNSEGISLPWYSRKPFFSALLDDRAGLLQTYTDLKNLVQLINNQKINN